MRVLKPCIEGVYILEFNTLHGTRIYAHSSAKAYLRAVIQIMQYFDCYVS